MGLVVDVPTASIAGDLQLLSAQAPRVDDECALIAAILNV